MDEPLQKNIIGIVGGMGPVAGVDLASKFISQTIASGDREHLPFILHSFPNEIGDRTAYILGHLGGSVPGAVNPGVAIARVLMQMERTGATVAGMACNSAHAPVIFERIVTELQANKSRINLLHMVREVGWHIVYHLAGVRSVGIVGTTGTRTSGLYRMLGEVGLELVDVTDDEQESLQSAIYDPEWGIKAAPDGTSPRAVNLLTGICRDLRERGAEAVVFGCTEFPLAYRRPEIEGLPVIDSSLVLARALVRAGDPERLRPWGT